MIILLIIVAAVSKSIADTLAHHFDTSLFKSRINSPFWNPLHPDNDKVKKIFGYPIDAWHIANSIMLGALLVAINFLLGITLYAALFIIVFNTFYNRILRRK